jgi:hypothetical protein
LFEHVRRHCLGAFGGEQTLIGTEHRGGAPGCHGAGKGDRRGEYRCDGYQHDRRHQRHAALRSLCAALFHPGTST